jgi:SpoVK/Ycf46/Vps4 family AAA+-type ATPase
VADPEKGLTKAEYEAFCAQLGIKPIYENAASAPADSAEAEPEDPDEGRSAV